MSAKSSRRPLAGRTLAALGVGLAVAITGCGAGQITQTDTQQSAVNGASGQVGAMALRDVELKAPSDPKGIYQPGSDAPLIVTIVNTGLTGDTLTSVSTPAAEGVTIDGSPTNTKAIPGGFAVSGGSDVDGEGSSIDPTTTGSPAGTTMPSSTPPSAEESPTGGATGPPTSPAMQPTLPGQISIVLTGMKSVNGAPLGAGQTIPVTFVFAHAGEVTLQVPLAVPSTTNGNAAQNG